MDLESAVSVSRDIYKKILFPAAVPVIQGLLGTRILLSVDKIGFLFPGFCLCITLKTIVKVYGIGSNIKYCAMIGFKYLCQ